MILNIFHIYHMCSIPIVFDVQLIEVTHEITAFGQNHFKKSTFGFTELTVVVNL